MGKEPTTMVENFLCMYIACGQKQLWAREDSLGRYTLGYRQVGCPGALCCFLRPCVAWLGESATTRYPRKIEYLLACGPL